MKRKLNIGLIATTALTLSGCNGSLDKLTNEQKDQVKTFSRSAAQVQGIRKALQAQGGAGKPQAYGITDYFSSNKAEAAAPAASTGSSTGVAVATGTASATAAATSTGAASTGIDKTAATTAASTGVAVATTVVTAEKQTAPEAQQPPVTAVVTDELAALGLSNFENFNSNTEYQTAFASMKSALKDKCHSKAKLTFDGDDCPFTSSLQVENKKSTFKMVFKDDLTKKLGYKDYVYTLDDGTNRLEMTDSANNKYTAEWTKTGNEKEFQEKTVFTFEKFAAELDLRQKADGTKTYKLNDEDVSESDYLVYVAPFTGEEKPFAPAAVQ